MIFLGDHTHVLQVTLKGANILKVTQERLKCLLDTFGDIISFSSSDLSYTNLIGMDIETDPTLAFIAFKPCTLPLKHQEWVRKELEEFKEAWTIQRSLSLYSSPIVIVPREYPLGSPIQEKKDYSCVTES